MDNNWIKLVPIVENIKFMPIIDIFTNSYRK